MFGECVVVGVEQLSLCLVSMLFYVAALCEINSIYKTVFVIFYVV